MVGDSGQFSPTVLSPLRSDERLRTFSVTIGGRELHCGIVSGLGAAQSLLDQVEAGKTALDFVEVMSCPGGCIGGGGQPARFPDRRCKPPCENPRCRQAGETAPKKSAVVRFMRLAVTLKGSHRLKILQVRCAGVGSVYGHNRDNQTELPTLLYLRTVLPYQGSGSWMRRLR